MDLAGHEERARNRRARIRRLSLIAGAAAIIVIALLAT
jgi:hypothetical protein